MTTTGALQKGWSLMKKLVTTSLVVAALVVVTFSRGHSRLQPWQLCRQPTAFTFYVDGCPLNPSTDRQSHLARAKRDPQVG